MPRQITVAEVADRALPWALLLTAAIFFVGKTLAL